MRSCRDPGGSGPERPEQHALFGWEDVAPASPPGGGRGFRDSARARRTLNVREVYAEPAALASPRGQQVLARLPGVPVTEAPGRWRVPPLHGNDGDVVRWTRTKTETLLPGVRQGLTTRPTSASPPVVLRPGPQRDRAELLDQLDDVLPGRVQERAAAEITMPPHNQQLHEDGLGWRPGPRASCGSRPRRRRNARRTGPSRSTTPGRPSATPSSGYGG